MTFQRKVFYLIMDKDRESTYGICHSSTEAAERIRSIQKRFDFPLKVVRTSEKALIEAMGGWRY